MPFILTSLVLTGSRGAGVAILGASAVLTHMQPMDYRHSFYTLTALGLVLFVMFASRICWQRLGTITAGGLMLLTFGTQYRGAGAVFREGCGGKWVIDSFDLDRDVDAPKAIFSSPTP